MGLGIIRVLLQQQVGVLLRLLEIGCGNQQVSQVDVSLIIVRLQFDGAREFLVGASPLRKLEIRLGKLVMSVGVTGVHLDCVAELNGRFSILAFLKVSLTTFQILLLTHIGIA